MSDTLFISSCISLFFGILALSIGLTDIMLAERENLNVAKTMFLIMIPFFIISFVLGHNSSIEAKKEMEIREKKATYYLVSDKTVGNIAKYCEERYIKYSTQETCKRSAYSALKYGESYETFKPSNVITKPSGVAPK